MLALLVAACLIAGCLLHEDRVGGIKDLVIAGLDDGSGRATVGRYVHGFDFFHQLGLSLLGIYAVEIDDHAAGVLAAAITRNLVDGRGHGANLHDLLVNLVEQQLGRSLAGQVGRERTVHDVFSVLQTADEHTHGESSVSVVTSHARGKDSDENNSDDKDHDLLVVAHPAHNLSKIVTVHGKK